MSEAERFVEAFRSFWRAPTPECFAEVLTEDVVLVQPLSGRMAGLAAAQAEFARIFAWLPDLRGEVDRWGAAGADVFIEFRLRATIAGRDVEWPAVDRFTLRGEKACERVSYFDGVPLLLRVLRSPGSWWPWWRSGAARRWW